eukprot:3702741-Pyramimonas_sp.AAC.1
MLSSLPATTLPTPPRRRCSCGQLAELYHTTKGVRGTLRPPATARRAHVTSAEKMVQGLLQGRRIELSSDAIAMSEYY